MDLYNNGGQTADLSLAVMERGISHVDNAYHVPNVHVRGRVCKTNLPSNTAFRGFGAPQAMFVAETIVDKVSGSLCSEMSCLYGVWVVSLFRLLPHSRGIRLR